MLSNEEKELIEKEMARYPVKSAASIEALKIVQERRRWISDELLADIAGLLEVSTAELENVATFYSLIFRKPVGRHVILVCDSISCWVMGYRDILSMLEEKIGITLGETTEDERFTLLPVPCLGDCDHAPSMMIDNDLHHDLNIEKLDKILDTYK